MWLLKRRSRGFYLCFALLLALAVGGSALTYADSGTATTMIKGGSLTESNAKNQVHLRLQNINKQTGLASYTLPIMVNDARGSGNGWNLTITSTTFHYNDKDRNKDVLAKNASHITGVSATCGQYSTCEQPANSISYPLLLPAGSPAPTPVKFFNAATASGLGKFSLIMTVNVMIPPNVELGTYTSMVIISIANGP